MDEDDVPITSMVAAPVSGRKRGRAEAEASSAAAKKATPAKASAAATKAASTASAAKKASAAKGKAAAAKKPAAAKKAAGGVKKPAVKKPAAGGRGKKKAEEEEGSEDDDDEEEGGDDAPAGGVKKPAARGKSASAAAAKPPPAKRPAKELKPVEMVEAAMKAFKWWEAEKHAAGVKWRTMEHRGVCFPPDYAPHGVALLYDGAPLTLTPPQEEYATFYASVAPDGPQLGNAKTAKIFNRNFWDDFKAVLGPDSVVKDFSKCDFTPIREHLDAKREEKKGASKDEKEVAKAEKAATQLQYGFALVDGHIEKMGNYTVEPPGLFRGRGEHPRMGTVKRRVQPEDVTLNVGSAGVVPPCPIPGHAWKRVVHDPTVTWLAFWKENVMGATKYVFLSAASSFKGKSDLAKYEKARRLKKHIDSVRKHYERLLQSEDEYERQSGTAMWIIDRLALRVGGEKDEDEADTVGCCSLRREHLSFPSDHEVTLDFLGKDSMRYHQTIELERWGHTGKLVLRNLQRFTAKKKKDEDVFDYLTPSRLNEQLDELMPGLSAKVFRTYNASITLERELEDLSMDTPGAEKVLEYNRANREVAILCNHQRTVPKAFEKAWDKLTAKETLLLRQVEELEEMGAKVKKGAKVAIRSDYDAALAAAGGASSSSSAASPAKKDKPAAAGAGKPADAEEDAGAEETPEARVKRLKEEEAHLFAKQPTAEEVARRLTAFRDKLEKHRLDMRNKDENKAVALGTSKINYMDPRITVAWCKRVELPIEKVFPRTLRDKFPWAMGVPSEFKF